MDIEKVLMLPHLSGIKTALFTRRIIIINQIQEYQTFLGAQKEDKTKTKSSEDISGMKLLDVDEMKTL